MTQLTKLLPQVPPSGFDLVDCETGAPNDGRGLPGIVWDRRSPWRTAGDYRGQQGTAGDSRGQQGTAGDSRGLLEDARPRLESKYKVMGMIKESRRGMVVFTFLFTYRRA